MLDGLRAIDETRGHGGERKSRWQRERLLRRRHDGIRPPVVQTHRHAARARDGVDEKQAIRCLANECAQRAHVRDDTERSLVVRRGDRVEASGAQRVTHLIERDHVARIRGQPHDRASARLGHARKALAEIAMNDREHASHGAAHCGFHGGRAGSRDHVHRASRPENLAQSAGHAAHQLLHRGTAMKDHGPTHRVEHLRPDFGRPGTKNRPASSNPTLRFYVCGVRGALRRRAALEQIHALLDSGAVGVADGER